MLHEMICEAETSDEVMFTCQDCGRKVVVGKGKQKFIVLNKGNFFVNHNASLGNTVIDNAVLAQLG